MEAEASSDEEHFRTKEYRRLDRDRAALNPMILGKMEAPAVSNATMVWCGRCIFQGELYS